MKRIVMAAMVSSLVMAVGAGCLWAASPKSVNVREGGFGVTQFVECGFQGPAPTGPKRFRPLRGFIEDIECSPGGDWGAYLYMAVSGINQDFDPIGIVERVSLDGHSETFDRLGAPSAASHVAFAPLGWRDGDRLMVTFPGRGAVFGIVPIMGYLPDGTSDAYAYRLSYNLYDSAIDPTGAFGSDLFYQAEDAVSPTFDFIPAGIYRAGALPYGTYFTGPEFGEMRFGPGGAWGSNLYVAGIVIAPNGSSSVFPADFTEFDWAAGSGFDGDMFAHLNGADPGEIYRVKADGTATLFATNAPGSIAGCGGALWIANTGGCHVVERRGNH